VIRSCPKVQTDGFRGYGFSLLDEQASNRAEAPCFSSRLPPQSTLMSCAKQTISLSKMVMETQKKYSFFST